MKNKLLIIIVMTLLAFQSYGQHRKQETANYKYHVMQKQDTMEENFLIAVSNEKYPQYGSEVAYVDLNSDTIIPFGRYAYFGTDTLFYFANVLERLNDSTWSKPIAIDRHENKLFDLVIYDNGPDLFSEGLVRVSQNGKMGYANRFGQVVIPCIYDYAKRFKNGRAEVTFKATITNTGEHTRVESSEWLIIDKEGKNINKRTQR